MVLLTNILANLITLVIVFCLFLILIINKDKIRKWLYHKRSLKRKEKNNERIR